MAVLGPSAARVRATSGFNYTRNMIACSQQTAFASQSQTQVPSPSPLLRRPTSPLCARPTQTQQRSSFSTSAVLEKRHKYHPRDNNRLRGVSSIRRTGPREFLSVSNDPLPRPALTAAAKEAKEAAYTAARPEIDADHGLWQFFYDQQVAQSPTKDAAHGRAWTAEELRRKSWDDLHRLWWVCVKERNRIATASVARKHFDLGFGSHEADERDRAVRTTMSRIKHVLTERFYVWEDAMDLAQSDPEIDLSGSGPAFRPAAYLEEEPAAAIEGETDAAESRAGEQHPSPAR
ncbi:54S ribosomal protein L4 mitochondrial [Sporothrix curviconia]|uniref:Large ribosomal subunit protein uL29m n=1 Tax=Sporothrix curviconia TaxID=1260050 RepID=A0ABP0CA88_9PEZI